MLRAPFQLPAGFLQTFGYQGGRRFVALFWEPGGDEAAYEDGISYACGLGDNWLYLDFIHQPQVRGWLEFNGINLGNSDEAALHWLVVDSTTNALYAVPRREAYRVLLQQELPGEG